MFHTFFGIPHFRVGHVAKSDIWRYVPKVSDCAEGLSNLRAT